MKFLRSCLIGGVFFFALCLSADEAFVSAMKLARTLNVSVSWNPLSQTILFSKGERRVQCRVGQVLALLDGSEVLMIDPPVVKDAVVYVSGGFAERLRKVFGYSSHQPEHRVGAVLIDPGHGGKDWGTKGSYREQGKTVVVKEKDIALRASQNIYDLLTARYPDRKIIMTRKGDSYLTLEERVAMANGVKLGKYEAILYVSVHANFSWNTKASGFEVWYLPPEYRRSILDKNAASKEVLPILNSMLEEEFTMESIMIARSIADGMQASVGAQSKNRGVKEEAWFVVRNAKMPSVLVELGFVSNPVEARLLNDADYLKRCAQGIYNGLVSFITYFDGSGGFTGPL